MRDSIHTKGIYGPGKVVYYPAIDSGNGKGREPETILIGECVAQLSKIECLTSDWKEITVDANITYRVNNPVHFLVNAVKPIDSMKLLCETYLRDIILYCRFDALRGRENKKLLTNELMVNYFN